MLITEEDILFEDNHLLAVNKRAGILAQGDRTGDMPLVEAAKVFLKKKYDKPGNVFAGLVHRLDRPVTGIMLIAKTSKALERMNRLFQTRDVEKKYLAIVSKSPDPAEGKLIHWLKKDARLNKTAVFATEKGESKKAELAYKTLASNAGDFLLEARPLTGRPHQIRAQLSHIGCSIKGDLKYGYPSANADRSICLHACSLSFIHPVKKEALTVTAPLPPAAEWDAFRDFFERYRLLVK